MAQLLPESAYIRYTDQADRDRIDDRLRETLHLIPVTPGSYLDKDGHFWTRNEDGSWTDKNDVTRTAEWTPILGQFGPFQPISS